MKLWVKISLITSSLIILFVGIAMVIVLSLQLNFIEETEEINTENTLVSCLDNVDRYLYNETYSAITPTTMAAIVQYVFRDISGQLQERGSYFALYYDGEYIYNNSPYEPDLYIDMDFTVEDIDSYSEDDNIHTQRESDVLFVASEYTINGLTFVAFMCVDTSYSQERISEFMWILACLFFGMILVLVILNSLIIRKSLKPTMQLSETANEIAQGKYNLRTNYNKKDELGVLSKSFDTMADAIEDKIIFLNNELEKREFFIGALNHEIKTPISSIMGFSDTLLIMNLNEDKKRICANNISISSKYLNSISQKMLTLTDLTEDTIEIKEFDIQQLLENFDLPVEITFTTKTFYGDKDLIYSLIYNLCNNAVKYASDVKLLIEPKKITVTDKGKGIEDEQIPLITEAFYRIDKARSRKDGGMGLGLTICKRICEKHGGELNIESELDVGTKVEAIF